MNVSLKGTPVGDWRDLTEKELSVLLKSIEDSSSQDSHVGKKSGNTPRKKSRNNNNSSSNSNSAAKANTRYSKDGADKPAGSKGKGKRPFGDGKKSGGNGRPATNGKRPARGRGSKR